MEKPSQEQIEQVILGVFKKHNIRPPEGCLLQVFLAEINNQHSAITGDELVEGLQSLILKGFIKETKRHFYALTEEGFGAI